MRIYLFFPLAFLSGIYGFVFFAPYLLMVVMAGHLVRRRKAAKPVERPVAQSIPVSIHNRVAVLVHN